jgi:hypothetical protein
MTKRSVPRALLDPVVEYFGPQRIILFGSRARGEAIRDSDIDLLVVVDDDTPPEKLTWQAGIRSAWLKPRGGCVSDARRDLRARTRHCQHAGRRSGCRRHRRLWITERAVRESAGSTNAMGGGHDWLALAQEGRRAAAAALRRTRGCAASLHSTASRLWRSC